MLRQQEPPHVFAFQNQQITADGILIINSQFINLQFINIQFKVQVIFRQPQ